MALLYVHHSAWAVLLFFGPLLLARLALSALLARRETQVQPIEVRAA